MNNQQNGNKNETTKEQKQKATKKTRISYKFNIFVHICKRENDCSKDKKLELVKTSICFYINQMAYNINY